MRLIAVWLMRILYLQRVAVGLTVPVLTYMALSLLAPVHHERIILLAGSAWCAAIWAGYFLDLRRRAIS